LTADGLLVGCMRPGSYSWSDDLGQTWQRLDGIPDCGPEVYQPWVYALADGRVACAGHYGADDPLGGRQQHISLHLFRVKTNRKTLDTAIAVDREFDEAKGRYRNAYTLTLTGGGAPLPGQELEFWYIEAGKAGYDSWNKRPLEERMKRGGEVVTVRTGQDGKARVSLPRLDGVTSLHHSYQLVVRFNARRTDPGYKPAQTPQLEFYANSYQDPPLK
jgi:hypothetical protein